MTSGLPWGLALSSGVNTYLPLFLLSLFARFGHVVRVSPRFEWLVSDQAIFLLGLLALCEILAEKFPVLDNLWDVVHTLLRPLAGAVAAGATLTTNNVFEIILAMVMGGTLAAAAHSTKSSLRLMSTSKSFGAANLALSLGEDAAVLTGTLLSLYAPWVMLGVVLLFVIVFLLIGPRMIRTLSFDLRIVGAWLGWLVKRVFRVPAASQFQESLLELPLGGLEKLGVQLEPGEGLLGALAGWKRSNRGPRRAWVLLTSQRLLWVERRLLRRPRIQPMVYSEVAVVRSRSLVLFSKLEILNRRNESMTLSLSRPHTRFGEMAADKIRELAGLGPESPRHTLQAVSGLAPVPR